MTSKRETVEVDPVVFRAVYDSPASLPGRHRWTTPEADVRRLEKLLGMPARSIGAPLWVSGDEPDCPKCGRRVTWYDIVSSALHGVHDRAMIARVILGERKYVNTEVPDAIPGVHCADCRTTKGADGASHQGPRPAAHQSTSSKTRATADQRSFLSMAR